MAILPEEIPTGTLTGQYYFVNEDNIDADTKPELTVVKGFVRCVASVKTLRMASKKAVVIPLRFDAKFDGQGNLVPENGNGIGMEMPAVDSPLFDTTGWTWTATFELVEVETGFTVNLAPVTFQIFEGKVTDLSEIIPVEASPGIVTTRGHKGDPGLDGSNVLPTNDAVAQAINTEGPTKTALSAAIDKSASALDALFRAGGALSILYKALQARETVTCRLAFTGSSTTAGANATTPGKRYVDLLAKMIQDVYPSATGEELPVGTTSGGYTPVDHPGVQVVNFGLGGAQSHDYLSPGFVNIVSALKPQMITHMVGSNDWIASVPIATYKANLQGWLDSFRSKITTPCVHVYIHQHSRQQFVETLHTFNEYRDVLRQMAFENPQDVVFIDIGRDFDQLGVPLPDTFKLLDTDAVHLNNRGYAVIAELLRERLGLPAASPGITVPAPVTWAMAASDGFSGTTGEAGGRATDSAFGGTAITPTSSHAGKATISGGRLVFSDYTRLEYPIALQDVRLSFTITGHPPTGVAWEVFARRNAAGHLVGVLVKTDGKLALIINNGSGQVTYSPSSPAVIGDVVTIECVGRVHKLLINGVVKTSALAEGIVSEYIRFNPGSGTSGVSIDNLKIERSV